MTDYQRSLKTWGKYSNEDFYDSLNSSNYIIIKAEKELNEDDKVPTILRTDVVQAIETCKGKKPPEMRTYQWIYSRVWETKH